MKLTADKDTHFNVKKTVNCRGTLLDLSTAKVMGILNFTPDSFYRESRVSGLNTSVARAAQMIADGASVIDIGSQSTRQGAPFLDPETELSRIREVLPVLRSNFPEVIFSIDTFHSSVARFAVEQGCSLVNDVSGGLLDPEMYATVATLNVPFIVMHMQGTPATMQINPHYSDVVIEILEYFTRIIQRLNDSGHNDIILDPGFGFGKNTQHNFTLLKNLHLFRMTGYPVMAGVSRKSMIHAVLGNSSSDSLNGTTVLNTLALQNGASILRVHDVRAAVEAVRLHAMYMSA